jgi:hypothetical protein
MKNTLWLKEGQKNNTYYPTILNKNTSFAFIFIRIKTKLSIAPCAIAI